MTIAKLTITALITVLATSAMAGTDCKAKSGVGMFAPTAATSTNTVANTGVKTQSAVK